MQVLFFLVLVVGVFCVAFGMYEKLIDSILHFFKDIKKNFSFLLPIVLGAFIGIFLFSNILQIAFNKFYVLTSYAFIGLILGSLPIVVKQSSTSKITLSHIMCFVLAFIFSIYLIVLEQNPINSLATLSYKALILSGIFMSAGIVIPGVSKTAILMMLGIYSNYITAITQLDLSILFPIGLGLILGSTTLLFLVNLLFKHFKSYTYFLILGFVLGSVFVIYPGFEFSFKYIFGICFGITCFIATYKLGNLIK